MNTLNFLDAKRLPGAFVEPARAFRESQELVRASRRTIVLLLSLHADHGFETPDNRADHGQRHGDYVRSLELVGSDLADGRIVFPSRMTWKRNSAPVRGYPVLPPESGPTLIFWHSPLSQV